MKMIKLFFMCKNKLILKEHNKKSLLYCLPKDILISEICNKHLDIQSILSLMQTCSLFGYNNELKSALDKTTQLFLQTSKIVCGQEYTVIRNNGKIAICGHSHIPNSKQGIKIIPIQNEAIHKVFPGYGHVHLLCKNGVVLSTGANSSGQLGIGHNNNVLEPVENAYVKNPTQISCGLNHTLVLTETNSIMVFGDNSEGQLGLGHGILNQTVATMLPGINNVIDIYAGYQISMFLMNDGTLMGCGTNHYGQLGLGAASQQLTVSIIPNVANVKQVAFGVSHTIILLNNGRVMVAGYNGDGQLGLGDKEKRNHFTLNPHVNDVKKVFAAGNHTLCILNNDTVIGFGANHNGQLGFFTNSNAIRTPETVPNLQKVYDIATGKNYTIFTLKNGQRYICGSNFIGQLGLGQRNSCLPLTPAKHLDCYFDNTTYRDTSDNTAQGYPSRP